MGQTCASDSHRNIVSATAFEGLDWARIGHWSCIPSEFLASATQRFAVTIRALDQRGNEAVLGGGDQVALPNAGFLSRHFGDDL